MTESVPEATEKTERHVFSEGQGQKAHVGAHRQRENVFREGSRPLLVLLQFLAMRRLSESSH